MNNFFSTKVSMDNVIGLFCVVIFIGAIVVDFIL